MTTSELGTLGACVPQLLISPFESADCLLMLIVSIFGPVAATFCWVRSQGTIRSVWRDNICLEKHSDLFSETSHF